MSAYVELRMAALRDSTGGITPREQERVLQSHGISAEDLLRFVEAWGEEDPAALRDVWADVQAGIREAREQAALERIEPTPSDSASSSSGGPREGVDP